MSALRGDARDDKFREQLAEVRRRYMKSEGSLNVDTFGELPAELNVR